MFSKSCQYAIRAVLFLATESDEGHKRGVDELAEELNVPRHFLAKILQQLTKAKLISSSKGRNGGFYLDENNRKANLLAVVDTFDGPDTFKSCVLGLDNCSDRNPCPYHNSVMKYRSRLFDMLKNEKVEDSAIRINKHNLKLRNTKP